MTLIIAFSGRKQSGKTTSSQFMQSLFSQYTTGTSKIYNFADPLKQDICMNILGLTEEQCYGDDDQKNSLTNIRWENVVGYENNYTEQPDYDPSGFMTARQVMQVVGTDIFRKMLNQVWTNATIKKIKNENLDFAIIADCRFPNELEAIRNAGGFIIRLTRNPFNSTHLSEIALDPERYDPNNFDLVIDNESLGIDERNNAIVQFLKNKGMILS
jgi:hypothetical protein